MKPWRAVLSFVVVFNLAFTVPPAKTEAAEEPSLDLNELGFSQAEVQGNLAQQEKLHKRSRMLKTHQILGLITFLPMAYALSTADGAKAEEGEGSPSDRRKHATAGMIAGGFYFTTAAFAIAAPRVPGAKPRGMTKWHRRLAYIHFPAMVLAPIAGYQAKKQLDRGEGTHGLAEYHSAIAGTAATAFYLSGLMMVFNFGGKD